MPIGTSPRVLPEDSSPKNLRDLTDSGLSCELRKGTTNMSNSPEISTFVSTRTTTRADKPKLEVTRKDVGPDPAGSKTDAGSPPRDTRASWLDIIVEIHEYFDQLVEA